MLQVSRIVSAPAILVAGIIFPGSIISVATPAAIVAVIVSVSGPAVFARPVSSGAVDIFFASIYRTVTAPIAIPVTAMVAITITPLQCQGMS